MNKDTSSEEKHCSVCSALFACGAADAEGACWCNAYPAIIPADLGNNCQCPDCLAKAVSKKIDGYLDTLPHAEALDIASRYRGMTKLIENIDYTIEAGNYVFTRWYHLKRGQCCSNECRHCPYQSMDVKSAEMKKLHIALSTDNIEATVKDYTTRLSAAPCLVITGEYALWRTAHLNLSVRRDTSCPAGNLRHLGWEDSEAARFSQDKDVNGIIWERFSASDQADEIRQTWPDSPYEVL